MIPISYFDIYEQIDIQKTVQYFSVSTLKIFRNNTISSGNSLKNEESKRMKY